MAPCIHTELGSSPVVLGGRGEEAVKISVSGSSRDEFPHRLSSLRQSTESTYKISSKQTK